MDRATARRYLKSRDFYADREGIDDFLAGWARIRADHPDATEADLLAGVDLDRENNWKYWEGI